MGYMVYIDAREAWCASTLRAAQLLADGFICDRRALKIVGGNEAVSERTWVYDYRELQWKEKGEKGDAPLF